MMTDEEAKAIFGDDVIIVHRAGTPEQEPAWQGIDTAVTVRAALEYNLAFWREHLAWHEERTAFVRQQIARLEEELRKCQMATE